MGLLVDKSQLLNGVPSRAHSSVVNMTMPAPVINRLRNVSKQLHVTLATPYGLASSRRAAHVAWPQQKVAIRFLLTGSTRWTVEQCEPWLTAGWTIHQLKPSLIEQLAPERLLAELRELLGLVRSSKHR